ncbi:hypothetical protein BV140_499 [Haemophilus influenzae]|nr:hypothetical protein BV139_498 [Haemophilus influenzae]AVJ08128.1 hypothetical protein BV140_499 [Haemophilus influenzae]
MPITKLNVLNGNLAVRVFALCAKSSNVVGDGFDWLFAPVTLVFVHRQINLSHFDMPPSSYPFV